MSMSAAAIQGRINKALDKIYRFSDRTESYRQRIERGVYSTAEAAEVPRVQYNRRKFNRMDGAEQAEYERKLLQTKIEYRLIYAKDPDSYTAVPKMVHDWFIDQQVRESA
jgi:hypothetical protein